MNKYISVLFLSCLAIFSCKNTTSDKVSVENMAETFYQKELPYEGLSQKYDSITTLYFSAISAKGDNRHDELQMAITKRFNADGYLQNQECKVYDEEGLLSVESILYTRDSSNLQLAEKVNYLERAGQGYSITYNLIDRLENSETWEVIQQTPRFGLELKAEIRKYEKTKLAIFSQVGTSDSVVISRKYFYKENGLLQKTIQYNLGKEVSSELIEYNEDKLPITITKQLSTSNSPIKESIETRDYQYANSDDPALVEVYIDGEPVSIMEYHYHLKEKQ